MPPIAPSPQGSRAGLITALVIFVILFVTSTVMAIYYGTQWSAAEVKHTADMRVLEPGVTANVMANNPEVKALVEESKTKAPLTGFELAIKQRDDLAKLITSNDKAPVDGVKADTSRTLSAASTELSEAGQPLALSNENLLADIHTLSDQIVTLAKALAGSQAETKAANDKTTSAINSRDAALKAKDADIAAANQKATEAEAASQTREGTIKGNIDAIQKASDAAVAVAQAQTAGLQAELGKTQSELKKAVDAEKKAVAQLAKFRLNPTRGLLRPAGVVTRIPGNNTVFINLGQGDEISPGLTFEVYDLHKGLPSLTTLNPEDPDALLPGKASIEVIRTIGETSECRIIHVAAGQQIVEGDLILNLIYNTHTRFAFMVYGDFDLAQNGQVTPGDADVIRRLITQWGGRVMDEVNVDTDFIVLGKEPTVTPLPDNPTPLDQERHDKQQKAYDAYFAHESEAIHLSIPILNQNRFLYFIGYYDQAKR